MEAQVAPVQVILDRGNGVQLFGNQSAARLRLGRMDANFGVRLSYDFQQGFTADREPGFRVFGDVRSALPVKTKDELSDLIIIGINNAPAVYLSTWKK